MSDIKEHGEGCTCGCQDGEEELMSFTLEFDDGESVEVVPFRIFPLGDKEYIALLPVDEEADDVYIYVYNELEDDEFECLDIEDDDEFDRVCAEYERILEEEGLLGEEE